MVFGKDVRVEWEKRDRYKRIVGKVWVQPAGCPTCPMTLDAGHAQITVGLAWWYRKYANEQSPQDRAPTSSRSRKPEHGVLGCGVILNRYRRGSGEKDRRLNADCQLYQPTTRPALQPPLAIQKTFSVVHW